MTGFELHMAIANERIKLKAKNHPRIQVTDRGTAIDVWCDGNEDEANRVINMTRKYRSLVDAAYRLQQVQA